MSRDELERLSKDELIDLVLRLQRPEKTSRTSSKPPATDRKEKRENAKPGGAKPGHEGHSRTLSEEPDRVVDHRPEACPACGAVLAADLPAETVGVHEHVELPVRARRSGRACMRRQPTSRPSRRCPTSGCKARLPSCSGSRSARAG
jgi:transposase